MADVADTEQPAGPPKRLRTWLTGLKLSQLSQIGTLVVLAATAMFGGLDTVNDHVTVGEPGTPFSDGEFTVTVERASLVPKCVPAPGCCTRPNPANAISVSSRNCATTARYPG